MTEPDHLKPWRSYTWKLKDGTVLRKPCECPNRIPGLDAEACLDCRIYWVDEEVIESIKSRRSKYSVRKKGAKDDSDEYLFDV